MRDVAVLDQEHIAGARFSSEDYIGGGVAAVIWGVMASLPSLALAQELKYQRVQVALLARILRDAALAAWRRSYGHGLHVRPGVERVPSSRTRTPNSQGTEILAGWERDAPPPRRPCPHLPCPAIGCGSVNLFRSQTSPRSTAMSGHLGLLRRAPMNRMLIRIAKFDLDALKNSVRSTDTKWVSKITNLVMVDGSSKVVIGNVGPSPFSALQRNGDGVAGGQTR